MNRRIFTQSLVVVLAVICTISAFANAQVRAQTRTRYRGGTDAVPAKLNVVTRLWCAGQNDRKGSRRSPVNRSQCPKSAPGPA